jgi:cytoskeletal protein RodZ
MTPQETFIARLRRYRQRNAISLDEISGTTRIKRELLEALESNDLTEWPRGLYARAWIRAYASAVGLDPIDTVDEFCRLFPHGDRRANVTIREIAEIVAEPSEYRDEFTHAEGRRRGDAPSGRMSTQAWHTSVVQTMRTLWLRLAAWGAGSLPKTQGPRPKTQGLG